MYWCYSWGPWFFFAWFPTYLVKGLGFPDRKMGIFASLPFVLGTLGSMVGGLLSDRMVKRYWLKSGRRAVGCASLGTSALLLVSMTMVHNRQAIGVIDVMLPVAWAVCLDIGKKNAGVVTGTMNTAGQLGGFVCAVLFGYIVRATGNYNAPLWIISAMVLIAALLFSRIDPTLPLELELKETN
jgi:ACS family glucarate transporter-like MFS transporter